MSLDLYLKRVQPTVVWESNITHNLGKMAREAGVYEFLWRPEEIGVTEARQLIEPLNQAIAAMTADPERFRQLDAPNGWGTYDDFLPWLREVRCACEDYPDAAVEASR